MNEPSPSSFAGPGPAAARHLDRLCTQFEVAWKEGGRPRIEDFLGDTTGPARSALLRELVLLEAQYRRALGERPDPAEYEARFPAAAAGIRSALAAELLATPAGSTPAPTGPYRDEAAETPALRAGTEAPAWPGVPGYEILSELGRGGMGVVYQARQHALKRLVALKMILSGHCAGPQELARFRSEAETVARLSHPHIVHIYEVGEHEGRPFFAMEHVSGGTLATRLRQSLPQPREAAALLEQLARALHAVHQRHIVHRDLKPANILLQMTSVQCPMSNVQKSDSSLVIGHWSLVIPKITDFGLSKRLDAEEGATATDAAIGTPSYMAPELASGASRQATPLADVYSLGAIMYECLTGRPPFRAATAAQTLRQVLEAEVVPPRRLNPALPRDLETICLECLRKEPNQRYADGEALADDLRRFQAGEPIRAKPAGWLERSVKWARRRPALAAAYGLLTLAVVLGMGGGGAIWLWQNEESLRQQAQDAEGKAQEALEGEKKADGLLADTNAQVARLNEELERYRYGDNINLAQTDWDAGRVNIAVQRLADCNPRYRDWEWDHLSRVVHPELCVCTGHTAAVWQVAFSPDGKTLASSGADGTVRLWDAADLSAHAGVRPQATLTGHTGDVRHVIFSPDGKTLASSGNDLTARLWDAGSGRPLATLMGHSGLTYVAFSPDGKTLASAAGFTIRLWDARSGKLRAILEGHKGPIMEVAFSPDGKTLASAGGIDRMVRLWDAGSGKLRDSITFTAEPGMVFQVAFSPDGKVLAAIDDRGTVARWDVAAGKQRLAVLETLGPGGPGLVAFSPDGKFLAAVGGGGNALFDSDAGKLLRHLPYNFFHATFSPDGRTLASAGRDGTVRLWDAVSGLPLATWKGHSGVVHHVAFSPDGARLAPAGSEGTVRLWDVASNPAHVALTGHTHGSLKAVFSPDGKTLASIRGGDATVRLWDAGTGQPLALLKGHTAVVYCLAFRPDSKVLASGGIDGTRLWDTASGKPLALLAGHTFGVNQVAFSPDGKTLVSTGSDGTARLWEVPSGKPLAALSGQSGDFNYVAFSPDSKTLASAGSDGTIRLREVPSGKLLAALSGHKHGTEQVAFSPDSKTLASAGSDGAARLWEVPSGKLLATLSGHKGNVTEVAFGPDGKTLASASRDGTVRLWDVSGGEPLAILAGHTGTVKQVTFHPERGHRNGDRLASGGEDGKVLLWDIASRKPLLTLSTGGSSVTTLAFSPDGDRLATAGIGTVVNLWIARESPADREKRRWLWREQQAGNAEATRQWFAAVFHLGILLGREPGSAALYRRRGDARAEQGHWQEALADFTAAGANEPKQAGHGYRHGLALLAAGNEPAYRTLCAEMLRDFGNVRGAEAAVAALAVLRPDAVPDSAALLRLAEAATSKDRPAAGPVGVILGTALYRAGRPAESVKQLEEVKGGSVEVQLFLAMAHHQLGAAVRARQCLADAVKRLNTRLSWQEQTRWKLLRAETEALLGEPGK